MPPVNSPLSSPDCLQFIVECHGNTLLPQFLGMYRLTVDGVETYMVVTRNVFSHRLTVHRKYDLKVGYVPCDTSTVTYTFVINVRISTNPFQSHLRIDRKNTHYWCYYTCCNSLIKQCIF